MAISLEGTGVDPASIARKSVERSEDDGFECRTEYDAEAGGLGRDNMGHSFHGAGGPHNLADILAYFLEHAET